MNTSEDQDVCQLLISRETFFCEAFQHQTSKTVIIVLSVITSLTDIGLLYGAIWYERFGSDNYRTLINRLFSSLCWSGIVALLIGWTDVGRHIIGPFPDVPCYFQIVMKDSIKTAILLFFDAIALSRYIFIYWMKNPTALNDDFWNLFVNLWIILGSILINITFAMMPGPRTLAFHICAGSDPSQVPTLITISNWVLLVVVIHQLTKVGQFWRCKLVMNVSSNLLQKFQECYLKVYCRIFVDTKLLQRIFSGDKMFSLGIISCLMRLFFKDLMLPKKKEGFILLVSLIIQTVVNGRIFVTKRMKEIKSCIKCFKDTASAAESPNWSLNVDKDALITATAIFWGFVFIVAFFGLNYKINNFSSADINLDPNYLYIYTLQLLSFQLFGLFMLTIMYIRNTKMYTTLYNAFRDQY